MYNEDQDREMESIESINSLCAESESKSKLRRGSSFPSKRQRTLGFLTALVGAAAIATQIFTLQPNLILLAGGFCAVIFGECLRKDI